MQIVYAYKSAAVSVDHEGPVSRLVPGSTLRKFSSVPVHMILPCDSAYLSLFYDYLAKMVRKDSRRADPVFETLDHFASLHIRSLAISPVAGCGRFLAKLDESMVRFLGVADEMQHANVFMACAALAWRFSIHGDD